MSRAYNVQINVGDLDHELMLVPSAQAADWIRGFQAGLHGVASDQPGNAFGLACFQKTKAFMDRAAEGGRRSAAVRKAKLGSAQPSKGVRENVEGSSKGLRRFLEVTSNQKPVTSNEKPLEADAPLASLKKSGAHMTRKGESITGEWKALLEIYDLHRIKSALAKKAPKDKWPSQVRGILEFEDSGGTLEDKVESAQDTMKFAATIWPDRYITNPDGTVTPKAHHG